MAVIRIKTETTQRIGDYELPYPVTVGYNKEYGIICAICDDLSLVSCGYSIEKAENGLEEELKDAIWLYVDRLMPDNMDTKAKEYRKLLLKILDINKN